MARTSYGRLIAYLVARSGDVIAAEDALSDAFIAALKRWTDNEIPPHPEAWLLLVARRKLIDGVRKTQSRDKVLHLLEASELTMASEPHVEEIPFPDERLKLLFVCAHSAIDPNIHTPLMLQTILGFNANQIASAFLVSPTTMSQRLVRAKAKIRDAGISFELPAAKDLPERLNAVLAAIYAAYTVGWESIAGSDLRHQGLAKEAIWLARLCVQLLPHEPEARGLLALMLFCEARRNARYTPKGAYVPLSEQATDLWSKDMIKKAEALLHQASDFRNIGRFQLEAAIQSAHGQRLHHQETNWEAITLLYEGLLQQAPTLGARVGHAAAMAESRGCVAGLEALEKISLEAVKNYQPYWALKAHLLYAMNNLLEAKVAYQRAIGLCENEAIRDFLVQRSLRLS